MPIISRFHTIWSLFTLFEIFSCQMNSSPIQSIFTRTLNTDVLMMNPSSSSMFLLDTTQTRDLTNCLFQCNSINMCCFVIYKLNGSCSLYSSLALGSLTDSVIGSPVMFQKTTHYSTIINTNGLVNYWPINNDLSDYIGNTGSLQPVGVVKLDSDRLNRPSSSIYLNYGYYIALNGTYFSGDFTIIGWVKPVILPTNSRFMDFSRGAGQDNVYLVLSNGGGYPYTGVWRNGASGPDVTALPFGLQLNQWNHLASTLNQTTLSLYINATLVNSLSGVYIPLNVTRTKCYIGKDPWSGVMTSSSTNAYFDDIKIYNRPLSQKEIQDDMGYQYP